MTEQENIEEENDEEENQWYVIHLYDVRSSTNYMLKKMLLGEEPEEYEICFIKMKPEYKRTKDLIEFIVNKYKQIYEEEKDSKVIFTNLYWTNTENGSINESSYLLWNVIDGFSKLDIFNETEHNKIFPKESNSLFILK
jgi:hypothetical protein